MSDRFHHPDELTGALHGVMAEFETADELVHATESAAAAGYRRMDGYSPLRDRRSR